ncbi:hypothetical protein [Bradyrhizobium liaoningense]
MSLRLLVMSFAGVLVLGAVAAVGAPSAMDVIATEPAEDLFATKPADPRPGATSPTMSGRPAAAPERAPAAGLPQRALGDNPLWAIPLARLTATRERPLFAPTRRPPVVAPVAMPVTPPPGPPPKPPEPETPQLSLLGTIIGAEKIGLFLDARSKSVVRLRAGENHNGWTLRAVERRRVELARGLDQAVLDLPAPDVKGSGTPGAPMLAGPPPMPAVPPAMPATPTAQPPVAANGGTYVHPGANMNLPIGRAMPANLRLPPGLVNPLADRGPR